MLYFTEIKKITPLFLDRNSLEVRLSDLIDVASPIIPASTQKIWKMLGCPGELAKGSWQKISHETLAANQKLNPPEILFRKVEDAEIEEQIALLGKKMAKTQEKPMSTATYEPLKSTITYEQFQPLDLRVGRVLEAIKVPKSKKLLKLLIDLGFEKRTVVSGIALSYEPKQLIGRKVVLIANLAPATIMGIESQGMILAAGHDNLLELPQIQNLPPGSVVA